MTSSVSFKSQHISCYEEHIDIGMSPKKIRLSQGGGSTLGGRESVEAEGVVESFEHDGEGDGWREEGRIDIGLSPKKIWLSWRVDREGRASVVTEEIMVVTEGRFNIGKGRMGG